MMQRSVKALPSWVSGSARRRDPLPGSRGCRAYGPDHAVRRLSACDERATTLAAAPGQMVGVWDTDPGGATTGRVILWQRETLRRRDRSP
jgi:hypothetical protein